jgi:hypothetical protein
MSRPKPQAISVLCMIASAAILARLLASGSEVLELGEFALGVCACSAIALTVAALANTGPGGLQP